MTGKLRVYGSEISYFTGKLEGYLRYKEIPYERIAMTPLVRRRTIRATGAAQMPAVELPDGRWMTDTTPMIEWFEAEYPEPAVIPVDPLQSFVSRLVEDYADEWMWRPAMHYRWSYRPDALLLSERIVGELMTGVPLPAWVKRRMIRFRQHHWYVAGDGVNRRTWDHVESVYLRTLERLEAIFTRRPFLLGDVPTLADFGFFASMFRHFGLDPTASTIMRNRAPAVWEWVARLWNTRASRTTGRIADGIPEDWGPILDDTGATYLPYLAANAEAWKNGQKRFDTEIQGVPYARLPVSRYRVWCLERLRARFRELPVGVRDEVTALLERHRGQEPLWRVDAPASGVDPEGKAPFGTGVTVYYD